MATDPGRSLSLPPPSLREEGWGGGCFRLAAKPRHQGSGPALPAGCSHSARRPPPRSPSRTAGGGGRSSLLPRRGRRVRGGGCRHGFPAKTGHGHGSEPRASAHQRLVSLQPPFPSIPLPQSGRGRSIVPPPSPREEGWGGGCSIAFRLGIRTGARLRLARSCLPAPCAWPASLPLAPPPATREGAESLPPPSPREEGRGGGCFRLAARPRDHRGAPAR